MIKTMRWYFQSWIEIVLRPIYFFTFMEKGNVSKESFSYMLISSWLFSAVLSFLVFVIVLLPMYWVLVANLAFNKFLTVLPVFFLLCFMFYCLILLILGGVMIGAIFVFFTVMAALQDFVMTKILGEKGEIKETIKSFYYSTSVLFSGILISSIALLTKYGYISGENFAAGTNIVMYLSAVYLWGLWSIATKKVYNTTRSKAIWGTLIAVLLVVSLLVLVSLKFIPILERWIS